MKRFATAALAALTFAAPLAVTSEAAAQHRRGNDHDGRDRDGDGRDRDWGRDGHRDRDWRDRRDDRRHYRDGRRDQRRWDRARYNGYTYRGQWYYGPPPQAYADYADYGYRSWRRGDRLPSYYQSRYRTVDYRHERLRAPPRGYRYVEDDRGDMLLVGIATGVILSVILSQ